MLHVKQLQDVVNGYFANYHIPEQPELLYKPIAYSLSIGGKRIRPVLCLMACEMFSDSYLPAMDAAAGIEIFHNFTLLHDDIMDKADLRRGKPTVHKLWNKNIALLSGDAMSIIAYRHIAATKIQTAECLEVFSNTALQICEGQQIDMDFENNDNVSISHYLEMIQKKTAVLIACSLKLGALVGGAGNREADLLYDAGINWGMAFQLQDDYLDVYGEKDVFGKNIGGDITANKKTYLLIEALNSTDSVKVASLKKILKNKSISSSEKIEQVTAIYNRLKIDVLCRNKISDYFTLGLQRLEDINIDEQQKTRMIGFVENIAGRKF